MTPLAFLDRSAAASPEQTAVVDGDQRLTWSRFREIRIDRLTKPGLAGVT